MTPRLALPATTALLILALAGCGGSATGTADATASSPASTPSTATSTTPATVTSTDTATPTTATSTTAEAPTRASSTPSSTSEPETTVITNSAAPATPRATRSTAPAAKAAGTVPQRSIEDYGDAAVEAWGRGDRSALARYVSPRAKASVASTPPAELLRVACDGDMCSYTSGEGTRVTLTFDRAAVKAGRTGGIVGVKVD